VVSTGSSSALQKRFEVGSLVVSGGSIKFPTVVQPGGVLRFSFNATDSKSVSIVLERSPYEEFARGSNGLAFAGLLTNAENPGLVAARNALDTTLLGSPAEAAAALRKANGGSTFASMAGFIPQQILAVSNTVDMHLDDLSAGGAASSALSMGVRIGAPSKSVIPMSPVSSEGSSDNDWRVWTSGYGSWARIDADEATGQGKVNSAGGGGVLGLERQMGGLKAGVLVTVGESVSRSDDPYLRVRSENWNIGGYGSINIGSINLDASALWGSSDQDSKREVPNGDVATARYTTQNWQAGLGVAVNLAAENSSWQVAPVARLKYINSSEDAFEETGSVLGIGSSGNNQRHLLSKLGLRVAKSAKLTSSVAFGVDGAAYWVHDYNSQGRDLQFQFGGTPYTVRTRDREADSTQFNLGMQATFSEAVTLRLSGQQDLSQNRTQTSGVFSVAYKF
jgi:outer membrane autotransporter protein